MKNIIIGLIILVLLAGGVYLFTQGFLGENTPVIDKNGDIVVGDKTDNKNIDSDGKATTENQSKNKPETVIGTSVQGNEIIAYHYGEGEKELLFVGGIHGGYSPNTSLVAYELMDYLKSDPEIIPSNVKVTVVPVLNPDGLEKVVGKIGRFSLSDIPQSQSVAITGRFNEHNVDLNRNFDCDWQTTGVWQSKQVSGGTAVFSEPEARAIRDYVEKNNPAGVVVWYASANGVFSSNCHDGILPETRKLTNLYASASGYPAHEEFDFYEITGDMVNWLAKRGTPAISVLLSDHKNSEWTKNQAGVKALLNYYGENN